jgi:CMP-N,N'-diacetyllegionaminic acid synthase
MKRLCSICARGGSKGVKNKNIKTMKGKPLIALTIKQALDSKLFDSVAVSSDSDDILAAAKAAGASILVKRPAELATDEAAKIPVIRHCLLECEEKMGHEFDLIVDLDCTSPLRTVDDIKACVELINDDSATNVLTAAPARRSPYFNLLEKKTDGSIDLAKKPPGTIVRRQDAPPCYDMNASVYVWKRKVLIESNTLFMNGTKLYVMPEERSIDIDSDLDFEFVTFLASKRGDL